MAAFRMRAATAGVPFPVEGTFKFIDISFLYNWVPNQQVKLATEIKFFQNMDPSKGQFMNWPIFGINQTVIAHGCNMLSLNCSAKALSTMQLRDFTPAQRDALTSAYMAWVEPVDQLLARLAVVHAMLTTKANKTLVILGHCECGCDRTGEFFGSYNMIYRNQSMTDMMLYNDGVAWRHQTYENQVHQQWVCHYLSSQGLYSYPYDCDQCLDIPCSPPAFRLNESSMC